MVTILEDLITNMKDPYYYSISKKINIVKINDNDWKIGENILYDAFFSDYKYYPNIILIKEWGNIPALCIKKIFLSKKCKENIPRYSFWITYDNSTFKKIVVRNNNFYLVSEYN